jgi:formylglycine-generating enzyme required for sulfatase activity
MSHTEQFSRRRLLQLGVAGAVGAALPAAGCGESSPTSPSSSGVAPSTSSSTAAASASVATAAVPDATFVRIPANPSFVFASGGAAEPIVADYCLSQLLVANDDYLAFVLATGGRTPRHWAGGSAPAGKGAHPVLWVSLTDAEAYCAWRTSQYPGWMMRLPTEAEWENAAAGPGKSTWPWGSSQGTAYAGGVLSTPFNYNGVCAAAYLAAEGATLATCNDAASPYFGQRATVAAILSLTASGGVNGWIDHDTRSGFVYTDIYDALIAEGGFTMPVGSYPTGRSRYGCFDMAGNACEWTSSLTTATNGVEAGQLVNAVRGGSWYSGASSCRATARGEGRAASGAFHSVGFRVAASPRV